MKIIKVYDNGVLCTLTKEEAKQSVKKMNRFLKKYAPSLLDYKLSKSNDRIPKNKKVS